MPKTLYFAVLTLVGLLALVALSAGEAMATEPSVAAAQQLGRDGGPVQPQPNGLYICEAEEFQCEGKAGTGWQAAAWGENYYAATFANSFLSRKAFLGAPAQCDETVAARTVEIREAGRFLVLARYEAAYRFQTQFRIQIEQQGRSVFDRRYGARENLKIWAFGQKLKKEVGWSWGAVENIVWEGHDAFVQLAAGPATVRLVAANQPEPAARRNVDLVMLTNDFAEVNQRIEKEAYLPLDGLLTQSGDVWLRVTNLGVKPLAFTGRKAMGGGNWQQHSPYWVHQRNWSPPTITVAPSATSKWTEVGGTMDTLNDGQWFWTGNGRYRAEFGWRYGNGPVQRFAEFTGEGDLTLAADADTRYSRRLRRLEEVLFDLLDDLRQANPAPHGRVPQATPVYALTFEPLDDGRHAAAVERFKRLFGLSDTKPEAAGGRGYIDVRSVPTARLAEYCRDLGETAENIAVVSLGDEIGLPAPRGPEASGAFRDWLRGQGFQAAEILPGAASWNDIEFATDDETRSARPGLYYWSKRYQFHFGIQAIKQRTDILRRHLPNASVGANFSPHYPRQHLFLGEVYKWVSVFRESGMTLPWSEDYIWQVPVGSPQMNHINLDLFRAGLRHHPDRKIMYYVMPHMPNNTPSQWRRLFYGALGHGMQMVNLFEFRPVHAAYTENHVDDPAMYRMVLRSFRELGLFEDIVQSARVRPGRAALWFSETGDIWSDNDGSFAAAKRALYTAIRHQQVPLDFVVGQDAVDGTLGDYDVLYLTDAHVSSSASRAIADWVRGGGQLFATAGAGMYDERNRPNKVLRDLLGVAPIGLDAPGDQQIIWLKQDLPWVEPVANARADDGSGRLPVYCVRSRVELTSARRLWSFDDKLPAVATHVVGEGRAIYCAFLPGLSYYAPAIPRRPVDRGATDDAMIHLLPTDFDDAAGRLIALPAAGLPRPVQCSEPLVETTLLESPQGTVIPLINWSGKPVTGLEVAVVVDTPTARVSLAGGGPVESGVEAGKRIYTLDLGEADALILRD